MGTNYYLKRIPTQDEIDLAKKLLDERKLESNEFSNEISMVSLLDQMTQSIHIGKSSAGWEFTYRIHDELYPRLSSQCFEFIRNSVESGRYKLINEYGDDIDIDDFIKMVESKKGGMNFLKSENKSFFFYDSMSSDGSWWYSNDFC